MSPNRRMEGQQRRRDEPLSRERGHISRTVRDGSLCAPITREAQETNCPRAGRQKTWPRPGGGGGPEGGMASLAGRGQWASHTHTHRHAAKYTLSGHHTSTEGSENTHTGTNPTLSLQRLRATRPRCQCARGHGATLTPCRWR